MTTFAYNNNVHLNIDRALNELFKNYVTNFANESENKFIKKRHFWLLKEQSDCEIAKNTCETYEKKLQKNKS